MSGTTTSSRLVAIRDDHRAIQTLLADYDNLNQIGRRPQPLFLLNSQVTRRPPTATTAGDTHIFHHKPLNASRNEIRLLRIFGCQESRPGDLSQARELRCQMRHFALDAVPKYIALSYTWGDSNDKPYSILVDFKSINVTRNLYGALLRLRAQSKCEHFWIDALCINQLDNAEKDSQIKQMPRIYKEAACVNVWLGEAHDDTGLVENFIMRLVVADGNQKEAGDSRKVPELSQRTRRRYGYPELDDPGFRAISRIFSGPWASRAWIIQEAALATEIVFMCGPYTFDPGEILMVVIGPLMESGLFALLDRATHEDLKRNVDHFVLATFERGRCKSKRPSNLLPLLLRHRDAEAKFAQDKVFALCGIAADVQSGKVKINIDSEASVSKVYTDTAKAIILANKNLDILSAVAATDLRRASGLPTWVPDWRPQSSGSEGSQWRDNYVFARREAEPGFTSCSDFKAEVAPGTVASPVFSGASMTIRAQLVDTLAEVAPAWTSNMAHPPYPAWEEMASIRTTKAAYPHSSPGKIESHRIVYYHTVTMDSCLVENGSREDLHELFREFDVKTWRPLRKALDKHLATRKQTPGILDGQSEIMQLETSPKHTALVDAYCQHTFYQGLQAGRNRSLALTTAGRIVLVPGFATEGDKLVLAEGGKVPLVLRKKPSVRTGQTIGQRWMHEALMRSRQSALRVSSSAGTPSISPDPSARQLPFRSPFSFSATSSAPRPNRTTSSPPTASLDKWRFVGDAYVHGIMDGEAWKPGKCEDFVLM